MRNHFLKFLVLPVLLTSVSAQAASIKTVKDVLDDLVTRFGHAVQDQTNAVHMSEDFDNVYRTINVIDWADKKRTQSLLGDAFRKADFLKGLYLVRKPGAAVQPELAVMALSQSAYDQLKPKLDTLGKIHDQIGRLNKTIFKVDINKNQSYESLLSAAEAQRIVFGLQAERRAIFDQKFRSAGSWESIDRTLKAAFDRTIASAGRLPTRREFEASVFAVNYRVILNSREGAAFRNAVAQWHGLMTSGATERLALLQTAARFLRDDVIEVAESETAKLLQKKATSRTKGKLVSEPELPTDSDQII